MRFGSFVTDHCLELSPADRAFFGDLLQFFGAILANNHVPTRRQDNIGWIGKTDSAVLSSVTLKKVVRSINILQIECEAAPLHTRMGTFRDCDLRLYFLSFSEQRQRVIRKSVPLSREIGSRMMKMGSLFILLGTTTSSSPSLLDAYLFTNFYTYFVLLISTVRPVLLISQVPPSTTCMPSYLWFMILIVITFSW